MKINFVVAGDHKYFYLLEENCAHIKSVYPDARIILFDFGLTAEQAAKIGGECPNLEIVDWTGPVNDLSQIRATTPPDQRHKLAIAVNARKTGVLKRFRKFMLKRFPQSGIAKRAETRALWFENLLAQKILCMKHASGLSPGEPLVFLDADAILFEPVDEIFAEAADVTLTLLENRSWGENECAVINSGVIFFGPDTGARDAFLDAWWAETLVNQEWLREQTAMVRFIERQAPALFEPGRLETLDLNGAAVRLRMVSCDTYNFCDMADKDPSEFLHAKIYHFADRRQEKGQFFPLLTALKSRQPR